MEIFSLFLECCNKQASSYINCWYYTSALRTVRYHQTIISHQISVFISVLLLINVYYNVKRRGSQPIFQINRVNNLISHYRNRNVNKRNEQIFTETRSSDSWLSARARLRQRADIIDIKINNWNNFAISQCKYISDSFPSVTYLVSVGVLPSSEKINVIMKRKC